MNIELLVDDLNWLSIKHYNSEFLMGLWEVTSALNYWSQGKRGHWMMFYMMTPAWRQDD